MPFVARWCAPVHAASGEDGSITEGQHDAERTVEAEVRARIADALGGPRGSIEAASPIVAFTVAYQIAGEVRSAVIAGIAAAFVLVVVRLVQRSPTRFVFNGLFGIGIAAVFATATGRAEAAFLPGILLNTAYATVMGVSILARWPVVGFLIGAVTGDATGWRDEPAMVTLSNRLTFVLMMPIVLRVAVQLPLFLAGEVWWLGVSRLVMGWPLYAAALAVAAAILARGRTPLQQPPDSSQA